MQGPDAGGGVSAHQTRPRSAPIQRFWASEPAALLFVAAAATAGALLLALGSRLSFLGDDWQFLVARRGLGADAILAGQGANIAIGPVVVYKGLLGIFGLGSALPYRVASTAFFVASVALLFAYLRRRLGDPTALAGAAAILFLGAAHEALLLPSELGYFASIAFGLAMLLALERRSRGGDRAACALLAGSVAFSTLGVCFAAGAAVAILLGPRGRRRRRAWVVAIPFALYGLWWIGWGREAETTITWEHVVTAPLFAFDGFASSLSSLLGLATPRDETQIGALDWGRPLLVAGLAVAGWRLWRLRRVPGPLIVVATIGASFWLLAGIDEAPGRDPLASRYQFVGAVFLLLIAAELLAGLRLARWPLVGLFAATALAVFSNLSYLHQGYSGYRATSELERADLGALEIARDRVDPGLVLSDDLARTTYLDVDAGSYLSAVDAYGSPAYTPAELALAPEPARLAADGVLARALGLTFTTSAGSPRVGGPPPRVADAAGPSLAERSCLVVGPATGDGPRVIDLPPGGAVIEAAPDAPASARLRRFATTDFPITAGEVAAGTSAVVDIPGDRSNEPWQLELDSHALTSVCGRGEG